MRTLWISAPWTWNFGEPSMEARDCDVRVLRRSSDWGLGRLRARGRLVLDSIRLAYRVSGDDTVVLSTMGAEAALFAWLVKVRSPRSRVVVFDFLAPRAQLPKQFAKGMFRAIDRFLVIRSGDAAMLGRRFGVQAQRCAFVPWPVRDDDEPERVSECGYVYSAGWAHRDWATLVSALALTDLRAKLATGAPLDVPENARERIEVLEMPSPRIGRSLAANAEVVAVVMEDTDLPAGPLVLLDALAAGKAVVATDVNGTRDYVRDGLTALVVRPGDADGLARALTRLASDPDMRLRLGTAARADILARCSLDGFWKVLVDQCR